METEQGTAPVRTKSNRRRRVVVALVTAFVLYSIVGFFVAPAIVRSQIEQLVPEILGLDVTVERVACNPYALSLTLRGVEVGDRFGGRLLATDELYVNAEVTSLVRFAAVVKEIRIEDPFVGLRRLDDGGLNFLEPAEKGVEAAKEIEEIPRFLIRKFVLNGGTIDLEDRVPDTPIETTLGPIELELRQISTLPDDSGDHALQAQFENGATLTWRGDFSLKPVMARGSLDMNGLDVVMLWRYVDHIFRFDVREGSVDAALSYEILLEDSGPSVAVTNASFGLNELRVKPLGDDTEVLRVGRAAVEGATMRWPESVAGVERIAVEDVRIAAWLREDGTLNWLDFATIELAEADRAILGPPKEPSEEPTEPTEPEEPTEQKPAWQATLGALEITDAQARFEDRSVEPSIGIDVDDIGVAIRGFELTPDSTFDVEIGCRIGESGTARVTGAVGVLPAIGGEVAIEVDRLDMTVASPYAARFARIELAGGTVDVDGTARIDAAAGLSSARFEGETAVRDVDVRETGGENLVRWSTLEVAGIRTRGIPPELDVAVRSVELESPRARVAFDENNELNLSRVLAADRDEPNGDDDSADGTSGSDEASFGPDSIPIEIGAVRIRDAEVELENLALPEPWNARLHEVDVRLEGVSTTGSTAELTVEGRLDDTGVLAASGTLVPLEPGRRTSIEANAKGIDMAAMSAYGQKYVGRRIDSGTLSTTARVDIVDDRLEGEDHLEIDDLELGEKVESPDAMDLPVDLAVGLLKDKNGRITLDVPLTGNLDDPGFKIGAVLRQATGKVVGNLVKSPFKLLGNLVGAKGDDIQTIEFAAGDGALLPSERGKLEKIVDALEQRPRLVLEVAGPVSPELDDPAIRTARVEQRIEQGMRPATADDPTAAPPTDTPSREAVLETLYTERFSADALDALRARHSSEPAAEGEPPTLDDASFYGAIENALIESEAVSEDDLTALAEQRAQSIVDALAELGLVSAERVSTVESQRIDAIESGAFIPCTLELSARS